MSAYYNENAPYAAAWLRNLVTAGLIPAGDVDGRSITDVQPADLNFTQCHFFAGIGGWAYATRLAGWPDDRPLWTGSPPCQNNSVAGAIWNIRSGLRGERSGLAHCWLDLVGTVRPPTVAFENVHGITPWLAEITGRLEGFGYRVSQCELSARDIAAPHQRRRVWVVADANGTGLPQSWKPKARTVDASPWGTPPGDVWSPAPHRAVGMADGFPARVAAIRAYGNAIVPQVAAEVIKAFMEAA